MAFIQTDSGYADAAKIARDAYINALQGTPNLTVDARPEDAMFGLQTDSIMAPPGAILSTGRKSNLKMVLTGLLNKSGATPEDLIELLEEMSEAD